MPPSLPRQDRVIHDYFVHPRLRLTLTGVIAKSSNIGTVLAASRFTHQQLYDYLWRFGLGQRTGIGVNGESAGVLNDWRDWSQINQDTIAFGQGVAVNAVQMAAAVNAIANGGIYVSPSLVKGEATTADGVRVGSDTTTEHRVVEPAGRPPHGADDGGGDQPAERHRPRRPGARATGSPARPGPPSGSGRSAAATTAPTRSPSRASRPPTSPGSPVYVVVQDPATAAEAAPIGGPAFQQDHELPAAEVRRAADRHGGATPRITW